MVKKRAIVLTEIIFLFVLVSYFSTALSITVNSPLNQSYNSANVASYADKNIAINLTVNEENATCFYSFRNASVVKMDNLTSNTLVTGTISLVEGEESIVFYCDKFNPDDSVTTTSQEILFFFDYCKSDIKSFYTDWGSCQSDRSKNRVKYYTDANYATCCLVTSTNEDCEILRNASKYVNTTETSFNDPNCANCDSNWVSYETDCNISDKKQRYYSSECCKNNNFCNNLPSNNGTILNCDYCIPEWRLANTSCENNEITQYAYDLNDCYKKTGEEAEASKGKGKGKGKKKK